MGRKARRNILKLETILIYGRKTGGYKWPYGTINNKGGARRRDKKGAGSDKRDTGDETRLNDNTN